MASMTQHSIASLFLPEYRRRILGLLLLRPEEALHGREIARRAGLPAGTTTRELGKLADAGILRREKRGNQQIYSADTSCPIFTEIASTLRKTSGMADVLSHALAPLAPRIRTAFVFGSVAQGRERGASDIDLLVVGDVGFKEVVEATYAAQSLSGREINPKVYTPAAFRADARSRPFLRDVLGKPKLFPIGSEHDVEDPAGH